MTTVLDETQANHGPAPSPFRFGLRALMLLMALCGVQFALMSYTGILWGLLIGLSACLATLLLLVLIAMISWRGSGTPFLHRLDALAIRLVLAICLLSVASFFAGGGVAVQQQLSAWREAARIQGYLGFSASEQMIVHKNKVERGLLIQSIALGGPFDLAGAQPGDVVICERGPEGFYATVEENRGREISITVAAGADMQPLEKCVSRKLDVQVPE